MKERGRNAKALDPSLVKRESFMQIWGFMRRDLLLEKTELLVYAIIFNFFFNSYTTFDGSREYLAEWTGCAKSTVDEALKNLIKKEYITKETTKIGNNIEKVSYFINTDKLPRIDMLNTFHLGNDIRKKMDKLPDIH